MTAPSATAVRLVFVAQAGDAPEPQDDTEIVVCDASWTPMPGARPDVIGVRSAVTAVLVRADLLAESLVRIDAWAADARMVDALTVDGVSYWFRLRETLWNWLHERLLWSRVLTEVAAGRPIASIEVLAEEPALVEVVEALGAARAVSVTAPAQPVAPATPATSASTAGAASAPSLVRRLARRLRRLLGQGPRPRGADPRGDERDVLLGDRVNAWAAQPGPRLLAVSLDVRHAVGAGGRAAFVDPHLDAVCARWRAAGGRTGTLLLGKDHRSDADWVGIADDADAFPASLLRTRWRPAATAIPSANIKLPDRGGAPLAFDGIDLGDNATAQVRDFTAHGLLSNVRTLPAISALLAELRPDALLMTHEGHREPWIMAARRASIPSFAIQHGILYATHPGYAHPRHEARMLADCTFVYGDDERCTLIEHGAYRPDEVEASGSPRLDLDAATADSRGDERAEIRRTLGVADGDRLLLVSTTNGRVTRRFDYPDLLARILGGPLPGIHVVFKLHPGEYDEGPYRATLEGLAAAGGYAPPPITVIKQVDLYALLRTADAHLGLNSTVLTEAVFAGTLNLIAAGQAHGDILGYVPAGVALPVHNRIELLAALDASRPADAAARRAFIAAHFREGEASVRIVERIRTTIGERA